MSHTICVKCLPETYADVPMDDVCKPCLAGQVSRSGSRTCRTCPVGTYADHVTHTCPQCPAGTYNDQVGKDICTPCAAGTYSGVGVTKCAVCGPGLRAVNHLSCTQCLINEYSNVPTDTCQRCPAGTVSQERARECTSCLPGTYADHILGLCLPCLGNSISPAKAEICTVCPITFAANQQHTQCDYALGQATLQKPCAAGFRRNTRTNTYVSCPILPYPILPYDLLYCTSLSRHSSHNAVLMFFSPNKHIQMWVSRNEVSVGFIPDSYPNSPHIDPRSVP
jgi:Tyrosine-protein kinase ephrin type A/B receptor-like